MTDFITALYLSNSAIACIAYCPQCVTLWRMLKTGKVNKSVSLATWAMWSWACSVTALYAFLNQDDFAFRLISFVNVVFCIVTLVLTAMVHHRTNQLARNQIHDE